MWRLFSLSHLRVRVGAGVVVIALAGCASAPQTAAATPPTTPTASASPDSVESLAARPLKLPALPPNSSCPISPGGDFANPPGHKLPGYGYGPGPVFLTGQIEWHSGEYALLLVAPNYNGPLVVRGRQLDGSSGTAFRTEQGNATITDGAIAPGQWRSWGGRVTGPTGCYGLQADGLGFSEVIVFYINPGPPPPA